MLAGDWREVNIKRLQSTIEQASKHAKQVVVFGPRPVFEVSPYKAAETITSIKQLNEVSNKTVNIKAELSKTMEQVTLENGATFFNMSSIQCPNEFCEVVRDNEMLYSDTHHFSPAGAAFFGRAIKRDFQKHFSE